MIDEALQNAIDDGQVGHMPKNTDKLHTVISVIEIAQKHIESKVPGNTASMWQFHSNVGDKIIRSLLFEVDALIADSGSLTEALDIIDLAAESDGPGCYKLIADYHNKTT